MLLKGFFPGDPNFLSHLSPLEPIMLFFLGYISSLWLLQPSDHFGCFFCTLSSSDVQNCTHYSQCGVTIDLYKGSMIVAVLFSVLIQIVASMEFAFFTAAAHWVNIFIELSTTISRSPSRSVAAGSDPISVYEKLGLFVPVRITHSLTLNLICYFNTHSPSLREPFGGLCHPFCLNYPK